jgi:hypothetical protein
MSELVQNPVSFGQALGKTGYKPGFSLKSKSLFKIWNFGVVNAKILPCRL